MFIQKLGRDSVRNSSLAVAVLVLLAASGLRDAQAAEIQVLLFGQFCQLQGPPAFSEAQLKAIHQISPEQTPLSETPSILKLSLERLKSATDAPEALLKYRQQRTNQIEVRSKLEDAIAKAHRGADVQAFAEATRGLIHPRRQPGLLKKLQAALRAGPSQRAWEDVRAYFIEYSGPDGEEDFHRTLRRLKVQYHCSFDEERTGEDAAAPAAKPEARAN